VTLDPDTAELIRRRMQERRISFKVALNEVIREGSDRRGRAGLFRTATASMGRSRVNLDRALQLAADLDDDEAVRKMRAGS
jgi:hypothetical protein